MKIFNLQPKIHNLKPDKGFTLLEMLVSISIFMVVMLVAASALLSIIDANGKAQSLKSAINNLNFALESMEKEIRVGTDYACGYSTIASSCPNGETVITFKSSKDLDGNSSIDDYATYRFNSSDNSIERCFNSLSSCALGSPFTRMTSPEAKITDVKFYIPTVSAPQRVLITISGEAGSKEKTKTKFNLQTTVSQRSF